MILLCPLIIANISGDRPQDVDKANNLRPLVSLQKKFEKLYVPGPASYV